MFGWDCGWLEIVGLRYSSIIIMRPLSSTPSTAREPIPIRNMLSENRTEPFHITQLPSNILEAFIPGYSIIAGFLSDDFGVDITLIVSIGLVFVGLVAGARFVWRHANQFFFRCFTSSISVEDKDDLFRTLRDWIAAQDMAGSSRRLTAVTRTAIGPDGQTPLEREENVPSEAIGETGLLHIGSWAARIPPRYDPRHESQWFRHRGRWFNHKTNVREMLATPWQQSGEKQTLVITCVGWSTQPIKELVEYVKVLAFEKERAVTVIRHPSPKELRDFEGAWSRATSRPSRSMNTVVLSPVSKEKLINDINEYLHPSSPKWYASRGIPYRRGYLFFGPPGTGKSSLSFALAGLFGLDIYVISLSEPDLSESDLSHLFLSLPRRCIVLLEDIDSAGLHREVSEEQEESNRRFASNSDGSHDQKSGSRSKHKEKGSKENDPNEKGSNEGGTKDEESNKDSSEKPGNDGDQIATADSTEISSAAGSTVPQKLTAEMSLEVVANAFREILKRRANKANTGSKYRGSGSNQNGTDHKRNRITLSGLLNAIDGVASHEGRILVMTTNHPERLDPALIRPGRVDMQIGFKLAARQQIRELFIRMYADDCAKIPKPKAKAVNIVADDHTSGNTKTDNPRRTNDTSTEQGPFPTSKYSSECDGEPMLPTREPTLQELAAKFASMVPEETLSPAEIQDYFIQRKKDPGKAVGEAKEWINKILGERGRIREDDEVMTSGDD